MPNFKSIAKHFKMERSVCSFCWWKRKNRNEEPYLYVFFIPRIPSGAVESTLNLAELGKETKSEHCK